MIWIFPQPISFHHYKLLDLKTILDLKTTFLRFETLRYVKFTGKAAVDTPLMHDRRGVLAAQVGLAQGDLPAS